MGGPVPIHSIKGDDQCFLAYFDIIEKSLEMAVVMMQAQNVDLYINGHDHCLEYIKHSDRYPFISYSSCFKHALDAFQTVLYSPTYGGYIPPDQKFVGELSLARL